MKYSQVIGVIACIVLCIACFFPWTYHPDLNSYFTGFYSYQNYYGRPGRPLIVLASIAALFFALNKVWAKRANLLVCALIASYVLKTYISFTSCYRGICPVKQPAIYILVIAAAIILVMTFLPRTKK
ncbi:MAG TPA: hypothetical protein VGD17_06600 [Chitinophagaceae bacterium]